MPNHDSEKLRPHRRLAAAIVGQAIYDAIGSGSTASREAREWLRSQKADRLMAWARCDAEALCSRLGSMSYVQRRMWRDDWSRRGRYPGPVNAARERTRAKLRQARRERLEEEG